MQTKEPLVFIVPYALQKKVERRYIIIIIITMSYRGSDDKNESFTT